MKRKLIKIALIILLILLILFGMFGAWTWYQTIVGQSLATGNVQIGNALGGLVIPETAVLYGMFSAFFLLLTVISIWITYRLVMFSPDVEEE